LNCRRDSLHSSILLFAISFVNFIKKQKQFETSTEAELKLRFLHLLFRPLFLFPASSLPPCVRSYVCELAWLAFFFRRKFLEFHHGNNMDGGSVQPRECGISIRFGHCIRGRRQLSIYIIHYLIVFARWNVIDGQFEMSRSILLHNLYFSFFLSFFLLVTVILLFAIFSFVSFLRAHLHDDDDGAECFRIISFLRNENNMRNEQQNETSIVDDDGLGP